MKRTCIIILLIKVSIDKVSPSCECGVAGKNRRIVGGNTVLPHQYPWLVALMLGAKLHCGGAIITDQHILSAGHCITFGVHYRDLTAYIGMHDRLGTTHIVSRLKNGVKHPSFTSNAVRDINDIAVLTLDKKVKFSDRVRPICLPDEAMDFKNIPLTVAGWGKTRQGALTSSRYLLETKVKIVPSNTCAKSSIYKDNLVSDSMMCAYSVGKDACQGDSGGPIFATHSQTHNKKWYQVGIVSWGIDCAMPDYPALLGRTAFRAGGSLLFYYNTYCILTIRKCIDLSHHLRHEMDAETFSSVSLSYSYACFSGVYTIVSKYINWIKQQTKDGMSCV